jgi:hypothetical protein
VQKGIFHDFSASSLTQMAGPVPSIDPFIEPYSSLNSPLLVGHRFNPLINAFNHRIW